MDDHPSIPGTKCNDPKPKKYFGQCNVIKWEIKIGG